MNKSNTARKAPAEQEAALPFSVVTPEFEGEKVAFKTLDLGKIKKAGSGAKPASVSIELSDETRELLTQFAHLEPEFKAVKAQRDALSKQISAPMKADYWKAFSGGGLPVKSPAVQLNGSKVLLVVSEKYSTSCSDLAAISGAVGAAISQFRQATDLKIEVGEMREENQQAFVAGVLALAQDLGEADHISAKQYIRPRAGFHAARTTLLTLEENVALDSVLPVVAFPKLG
jgi:hypothetical protein